MYNLPKRALGALIAAAGTIVLTASAAAGPLAMAEPDSQFPATLFQRAMPQPQQQASVATTDDEGGESVMPANLRRQIVAYPSSEAAGTIVIDTPHTYLYYVLGGGKAIRYGIGVGRQGFTWSGTQTIARKAEWPDWYPPEEMLQRQPYLPRVMAGGPGNPLGARAMYLGNTEYRIHGTNAPSTIGKHVSSGCIRMVNDDVIDLYSRASVGAKVVVLPNTPHQAPVAQMPRTHASVAPVRAPTTVATTGSGLHGVY